MVYSVHEHIKLKRVSSIPVSPSLPAVILPNPGKPAGEGNAGAQKRRQPNFVAKPSENRDVEGARDRGGNENN